MPEPAALALAALASGASGARFALLEGARALAAHAGELKAPLLALAALHAAAEFAVPVLWPGAYACLRRRRRDSPPATGGREAKKGVAAPAAAAKPAAAAAAAAPAPALAEEDPASPEARAAARGAARDGRNKVVASCFAAYVSALSLAALASGDAERLRLDPFASSPATAHLSRVATAYFVYDVACLALWDADFEPVFLLHGALCLWVFACSLQPFLHYMALVTLLFEASTPFLHARAALLAAGLDSSPLFAAANWCFMLSFAASRVLFGLYAIFAPGQWWSLMEALVARGDARLRGVAVVRTYQVCAVLLSALNLLWMWRILSSACKQRGAKKDKGA